MATTKVLRRVGPRSARVHASSGRSRRSLSSCSQTPRRNQSESGRRDGRGCLEPGCSCAVEGGWVGGAFDDLGVADRDAASWWRRTQRVGADSRGMPATFAIPRGNPAVGVAAVDWRAPSRGGVTRVHLSAADPDTVPQSRSRKPFPTRRFQSRHDALRNAGPHTGWSRHRPWVPRWVRRGREPRCKP